MISSSQQANNLWSIYNQKEKQKQRWLIFMYYWFLHIKKVSQELKRLENHKTYEAQKYKDTLKQSVYEELQKEAYNLNIAISKHLEEVYKDVFNQVSKDLGIYNLQMPSSKEIYNSTHEVWVGNKNVTERIYWNVNQIYQKYLHILKTVTDLEEQLQELDKLYQNFEYRIHRLVRTETMHTMSVASLRIYRAKGIQLVRWVTTMDEKTCPICASRDNKIYPIMAHPNYPDHPFCRCVLVAVVLNKWR